MKKIIVVMTLVISLALLTSCVKQSEKIMYDSGNIKVYTSIYPMYDFAKKIGGSKIDIELMVPPGAEPHDWEPTAKLMAQIEKSDVVIYNGVEVEPWIDRLLGSIGNKNLIIVEASKGIDLLTYEDEHHEGETNEEHEEHGEFDPHIWLDPLRAIEQGENIKDAFVQADSKNKEFYESNFKDFKDKLIKLDESFKGELANKRINKIVVSHGAFGYLANRYGLEQISISGLTPQEEPSAVKMAEISEVVKENNIKYIFFETLSSPKLSKVIANETGSKTAVLNPVGGLTKEELEAGKDYITIMNENLKVLKQALY